MSNRAPNALRFHDEYLAAEIDRAADGVVTAEHRYAVLRRMLPATVFDVKDVRADLWPDGSAGRKRLQRDLRAIGARPKLHIAGRNLAGVTWVLDERT